VHRGLEHALFAEVLRHGDGFVTAARTVAYRNKNLDAASRRMRRKCGDCARGTCRAACQQLQRYDVSPFEA